MAFDFGKPLRSPIGRLFVAWALFIAIGFSLGYPTLNRYDAMDTGLADAVYYKNLVEKGVDAVPDSHWRYRVLVPYLAKPVYALAKGRVGSWNPTAFALLVINSLFIASAALLLLLITSELAGRHETGLIGALLFLGHFNVSNFYLSGLVDSGEVFFMILLIWALLKKYWSMLPIIGLLGALARETFVPFSAAMAGGWYLYDLVRNGPKAVPVISIIGLALVSLLTVLSLRALITGGLVLPTDIASKLWVMPANDMAKMVGDNLFTKGFLYTFIWLLPLGLLGIKSIPMDWRLGSLSTLILALVLSFKAGAGENIGRPLFSAAGPMLIAASAIFITNLFVQCKEGRNDEPE